MNKSWIRTTVVAVLTLLASLVHAATETELRVFSAKSFAEIKQAHAGKPFILAFWSVTCEPCREEMMVVTEVHKKYPGIPIVLVAADSPNTQQQVRRFLSNYTLGRIQTWQFGDDSPERLRYSVDRAWAGELPRSYLFNAKHEVAAHSGVVELKELLAWAERETRTSK